jgi:hypothetical protein
MIPDCNYVIMKLKLGKQIAAGSKTAKTIYERSGLVLDCPGWDGETRKPRASSITRGMLPISSVLRMFPFGGSCAHYPN